MGLLLFGKDWSFDGLSEEVCNEDNVGLCQMMRGRIVAEPLVQETSAGLPGASWDTGVDPKILQARYQRFPKCCDKLAADWMQPVMNVGSGQGAGIEFLFRRPAGMFPCVMPPGKGSKFENGKVSKLESVRSPRSPDRADRSVSPS